MKRVSLANEGAIRANIIPALIDALVADAKVDPRLLSVNDAIVGQLRGMTG